MIKKFFSLAIVLLTAAAGFAQNQELPLDPNVRHGVLDNGLQYFIMHNEQPKERANFYIAQKVGSTLETSEQLGLAHFLEHMAFNGTSHYPGKAMLNYLQSKGIRFGADINAYTDFDETVYNINNVPTTDAALMDSVLLAIHDWSCEILLQEDEINAERGVIEEEWRMRNDANSRMVTYALPKLYEEYNYQQMPIGKMEVVKNFPPEVLRAYYEKWYRPDQQGIVIVGDFDVAQMEEKVKALFGPIKMPENAAERTYPTVSDNKEPIYVYFEDAEFQFPRADFAFKSDKLPFEMRNTFMGFLQTNMLEKIIAQMINNRLSEYAQKPECKYALAVVNFGNYWVSKTKAAFNIIVIGKSDIKDALTEAMQIVSRACKTGFTDSELARVRDEIISGYESAFNERNNTKNEAFARKIIRNFIDNSPNPGIETEFNLVKQIFPMIQVQMINQAVTQLLTPENQVLVISQPKKEGFTAISSEEIMPSIEAAINADYEAYVDEVITEPLLNSVAKPGSVKSQTAGKFDTSVLNLSNGMKVIVKPTDFKADQIVMMAYKNGGKNIYPEAQAANVLLVGDAYESSKLGNFNQTTLKKYLAGKKVSLGFNIGSSTTLFEGNSTVKDLPTLMELFYASFTAVSADEQTYNANMDQAKGFIANLATNPEYIFSQHVNKAKYAGNPMFEDVNIELIDKANYSEMLKLYQQAVSNAADFTLIFVGNVDVETLKPLLEKYVASLPAAKKGKKSAIKAVTPITTAMGQVIDNFKQPMQNPISEVYDIYTSTATPYNIADDVKMTTLGQILRIIYTNTLREEMGGTYSPAAGASFNPYTDEAQIVYLFQTNADMLPKMIERAEKELDNLVANGAPVEDFNKVKEANIKQYQIQVRENGYWLNNLMLEDRGYDVIAGHKAAVEDLSIEDFNKFMKSLNLNKNRVQVIMEGVAQE